MLNVKNIKLRAVTKKAEVGDLAEYVRAVRTRKGLSVRDVAENSGGLISSGYVSQIENRYVRSVTTEKLRALARGLGCSDEELIRAAASGFGASGEDEIRDSVLYKVHQRLKTASDQNKRVAEEVLEMLLDRLDRQARKQ
jgi:transcriptional regulator with XRE-family HTH domain